MLWRNFSWLKCHTGLPAGVSLLLTARIRKLMSAIDGFDSHLGSSCRALNGQKGAGLNFFSSYPK
jgi:hypothetical protein